MRIRAVQEFSLNFQPHEQQETTRLLGLTLLQWWPKLQHRVLSFATWVCACLMFACGIQQPTINFNLQTHLTFSVLGTLSPITVGPDSKKKKPHAGHSLLQVSSLTGFPPGIETTVSVVSMKLSSVASYLPRKRLSRIAHQSDQSTGTAGFQRFPGRVCIPVCPAQHHCQAST